MAGCGPVDSDCTLVFCRSMLAIDALEYDATAVGGTVTVCRNDECVDAAIDAEGERTSPAVVPIGEHFRVALWSDGSRRARLDLAPGGERAIDVEGRDTYRLELVAHDGTLLAAHEWIVSYERFRPNGPGCDPECTLGTVVE
ncbi:hypothetical protein DB32_007577 [Sandaracinus amylolyticus]|uniref:Uncharacterized protein n=1 Tax=Sandaracinus amylolyticus TaxID=927083 RepID=A0A0F6YLY0_9BACT|nr:hypothetical protein DB32_007577 [Sandaracinus amylolyticus]